LRCEAALEPERVVGLASLGDGERVEPVHAGKGEDVGDAIRTCMCSPARDERPTGVFGDGGCGLEVGVVLGADGVTRGPEIAWLGSPPRVKVDDEEAAASPALGEGYAALAGAVVRDRVRGRWVQEDEDGGLAGVRPLPYEEVAISLAVGQDCGAPYLRVLCW
jgi:hypothetical protein